MGRGHTIVLDDFREICRSAVFYGVTHPRFFVNSNGSVSFDDGVGDFTPTVLEFLSGPPRIAGLWTDLEPNAAGVVSLAYGPASASLLFETTFGQKGRDGYMIRVDDDGTEGVQTECDESNNEVYVEDWPC